MSTVSIPVQATDLQTAEQLAQQGLVAGKNYPGLTNLCALDKPLKQAGAHSHKKNTRKMTDQAREKRAKAATVAPQQVFDNLYFVGNRQVASWVIRTSEGLIMIDAMNTNQQAKKIIIAGMESLGLDPNELRYLIITHAHGDHYGGQEYLTERFSPRLVMSEADWRELEKPKQEISNPRWGKAPTRDLSVDNGDTITLGDTRIQLAVTPGHTLGTLSLIFPVQDQGKPHMAALWGGTGLNFGPNAERLAMYSSSAEQFRLLAQENQVDVFLSNHPTRDNSLARMKQLNNRNHQQTHPFVDPDALQAFALLRDCSQAQLKKLQASQ
ncbi:MBL fold metallo-hydrolase [Marinomonas pollencensis]|uniref:beta-lactamase n=1 Tax=Marinomonas pollencensis TaxID=491954 RepID=A0A3E0DHP5_9GAMM|nr:MBL fold metallo-hydrolase [Marinomonas pollencensis]REG82121.1 metallo-beta-lactamase class B [Marinomonas pollencensis]